jgi:hypothetical protein
MLARAGLLVPLGACLLSMACKPRQDVVSRPLPYTFEMGISAFEPPDDGVEVVYDEEVLGKAKPNAPIVRVTLPNDVYLVDAKGRLRARVEGSCGKQEIPLRIPYADRNEESQALRYSTAKPAMFEADNPTVVRVYFDNENAPATTLTIGARTVHIAAGSTGMTTIVIGSCATARQVIVGGTKIGELPASAINSASLPVALVDLVGARCYKKRVHLYKDDGTEKKFDKSQAKGAPKPPKGVPSASAPLDPSVLVKPEETILKGDRVYSVGRIDDFLATAPNTLIVHDDPKLLNRTEILRCEKLPPPPPQPAASASAATTATTPTTKAPVASKPKATSTPKKK